MGSPPGTITNGMKHPSMMSINKSSNNVKDSQPNGDLMPTRRKSTNSLVTDEKSCNGSANLAPLRRKSMVSANENNSVEYHRRKLILDVMPTSSNQKAGSLF